MKKYLIVITVWFAWYLWTHREKGMGPGDRFMGFDIPMSQGPTGKVRTIIITKALG